MLRYALLTGFFSDKRGGADRTKNNGIVTGYRQLLNIKKPL